MKKVFALAAAFAITAAGVSAATTQITGEPTGRTTSNADYPVEIRGADGNLYACSIDIVAKNGAEVRRCVAGDKGGMFAGGLGAGGILLIALGVGAVAAAAGGGGGSSTNGTN